MKSSELDYELPAELIAQRPLARRDGSRLLVHDRERRETRHRRFDELPDELADGTLVVVNDTRVLPARLPLERPRGEVLLLEPLGDGLWEGLARPTRRLRAGRTRVSFTTTSSPPSSSGRSAKMRWRTSSRPRS